MNFSLMEIGEICTRLVFVFAFLRNNRADQIDTSAPHTVLWCALEIVTMNTHTFLAISYLLYCFSPFKAITIIFIVI